MKQYRQGDVFLQQTTSLPKGSLKKSNTVAFGEVTGHHHTFDENATVYAHAGQQYVVVERDHSTLSHQEHDAITIPKGMYRVVLQREYDLVDGVRAVMD